MNAPWFDLRRLIPPTLDLLDDDLEEAEAMESDPEKLKNLDLHTRLIRKLAVKGLTDWKTKVPDASAITLPKREGDLECQPLGLGGIEIPVMDEDHELSRFRLLTYRALRSRLVPLEDQATPWDSPAEAIQAFESFLPRGTLLSEPNHHWDEMASDEAQSRLAFAGLGALRLMPVKAPDDDPDGAFWASDFGWMAPFEVREGFERYGAIAYFNRAQEIVRIHWSHPQRDVRPGDADWEHAKWAWRCSLMVGTTVADHLVAVHLVTANYVALAARSHLGVNHPLRRLLKPFIWRTLFINYSAAYSLCPERGFLHRSSAFTYPALKAAFDASVQSIRYTTAPRLIAAKKAAHLGDDFPWAVDALALYEVIHAFVDDYLSQYFAGDAITRDPEAQAFWETLTTTTPNLGLPAFSRASLVELLAQAIWGVTGLHEAVGSVVEYATDPTFTGTKIRPGTNMADVQASVQSLIIVALTGLEMPRLLGDFSHLCLDEPGAAAFQRFHDNLTQLADRIDDANQTRRWPCNAFNPRYLEASVSI